MPREKRITAASPVVALYTDFGVEGPYVGEMTLAVERLQPSARVVSLMHDAWPYDVQASAYLLPAVGYQLEAGDCCVAIVDPGVGTARHATAVLADDVWYVGPDNGLLAIIARRAQSVQAWHVEWQPADLSMTFHGRDLFAPVGAALAGCNAGDLRAVPEMQNARPIPVDEIDRASWPADLPRVIYVDRYGNLMTGLRAASCPQENCMELAGVMIRHAPTFAEAPAGKPFWYANSQGLVEIAVNQGSASHLLEWRGEAVRIIPQ